jgi:hypothetical protein
VRGHHHRPSGHLLAGPVFADEFTIRGKIRSVNAAKVLITVIDNGDKLHTLPVAVGVKLVGVDGWDGGRGKDQSALKAILSSAAFKAGTPVTIAVTSP